MGELKSAAPRQRLARINGLHLAYLEWGSSKAEPILMLHGLRSYAYTWEPVAAALVERYRVLALDQRGRGESDWDQAANYFTEAYVSDLAGFVDQLGLDRFVLLGHSMGGTNALVYASRHPERMRGLIIEDLGPGSSTASGGAARIRGELRDTPEFFATWADARAFWRRKRPLVSEAALESRVKHSLRERKDGKIVWKYDHHGIAGARLDPDPAKFPDLWPSVEGLRCPTLLLRGARSDFLDAETARRMALRNPHIQWLEIPDASHYVHDDNLGAFNRAVGGFLDRLPIESHA